MNTHRTVVLHCSVEKLLRCAALRGGVHIGVAHARLNATEYVRDMHASRAWRSTTGPADLVGTRFFEVRVYGARVSERPE